MLLPQLTIANKQQQQRRWRYLFLIATVIVSLLLARECSSTAPFTWQTDISQGNWWCSSTEANDFYPIQERHLDYYNAIHLSSQGLTTRQLCNFYFAASEPIIVDWLQKWSADDSQASLSMYTRYYSFEAWRLMWSVSSLPKNIIAKDVPASNLVRLEFRNPSRRQVNFSVLVRPLSYAHLRKALSSNDDSGHETAAALANASSRTEEMSYYGMDSPYEWELGLIIVSATFGFSIIGIALYLLIIILCKQPHEDIF